MPEPADRLYLRLPDRVLGPLNVSEITRLLIAGQVRPQTLGSPDGATWTPLSELGFRDVKPRDGRSRGVRRVLSEPNPIGNKPPQEHSGEGKLAETPRGQPSPPATASSGNGKTESLLTMLLQPASQLVEGELLLNPVVRGVLIAGAIPLVLSFLHFSLSWKFEQSVWLISGYFCLLWAFFFRSICSPSVDTWRAGVKYALFTAFLGIPVLLVWQNLPWIGRLYAEADALSFPARLIANTVGVGLFEEICKALPLFIFGLKATWHVRSPREGAFLGILSGLGFALNEGVGYSLKYWRESASVSAWASARVIEQLQEQHGTVEVGAFIDELSGLLPGLTEYYGGVVLHQIVRLMTLPLLHAAWSGISAYFIALAFLRGRWALMPIGISLAAVLHGMYNASQGGVSVMVAIMSILLMLGCLADAAPHGP